MEPVDIVFQINNDDLAQQAQAVVNSILGIGNASSLVAIRLEQEEAAQQALLQAFNAGTLSANEYTQAQQRLSDIFDHVRQSAEQLSGTTASASENSRNLADSLSHIPGPVGDIAGNVQLVAKAKTIWAAAVTFLNAKLGISVTLCKALLISGIGALIAGAGLAYLAFKRWSDEQEKQMRLQRQLAEINYNAAGSIAKVTADFDRYTRIVKASAVTDADKVKVLNELNERYGDTFGRVKNIRDLEEQLINRAPAYIAMMGAKARAQAAMNLSIAAQEETLKSLAKSDKDVLRERLEDLKFNIPIIGSPLENLTKEIVLFSGKSDEEIKREADVRREAVKTQAKYDAKIYTDAILESEQEATRIAQQNGFKEFKETKAPKVSNSSAKDLHDQFTKEIETWKLYYKMIDQLGKESADKVFSSLELKGDSFTGYLKEKETELQKIIDGSAAKKEKTEAGKQLLQVKELQVEMSGAKPVHETEQEAIEKMIGRWKEFEDRKKEMGEAGAKAYSRTTITSFENLVSELEKKRIAGENLTPVQIRFNEDLTRQIDDLSDYQMKKTMDTYQELLEETKNLEQKKADIQKNYPEKTELLKNDDSLSDAERASRLDVLRKQTEEELNVVDKAMMEQSDAYKQLAITAIGEGKKAVEARIKLIELELSVTKKGTLEEAELLKQLKDLNKEKAGADFDKAAEYTGKIAEGLREAANFARVFDEDIAGSLDSVAELTEGVEDLGAGLAKIISGQDIIGGISALLSGLTKVAGVFRSIRDSSRQAQEAVNAFYAEQLLLEIDYNKTVRERKKIEDAINKSRMEVINAEKELLIDKQKEAQGEYDRLFAGIQNEEYKAGEHTEDKRFLGVKVGSKVVEDWASLSGMTYDQIERLYSMNLLSDAARAQFERLKALHEEISSYNDDLQQNEEKRKETLTGTTARAIADSIAQGVASGKKTFKDYADDIEGFLRGAIVRGLSDEIMKGQVQKLYEEFAEMFSDGELSAAEQDAFKAEYMAIVESQRKRQEALEKMGFTDAYQQSPTSKGIQTLTQDQGEELNGRFTALQMAGEIIKLENVNQTLTLAVVSRTTESHREVSTRHLAVTTEIRDMMVVQVKQTKMIADNTAEIGKIKEVLDEIKKGTDRI